MSTGSWGRCLHANRAARYSHAGYPCFREPRQRTACIVTNACRAIQLCNISFFTLSTYPTIAWHHILQSIEIRHFKQRRTFKTLQLFIVVTTAHESQFSMRFEE